MLLEMTGQKTVPNVFVNKTHIGGCDKTLQVRIVSALTAALFYVLPHYLPNSCSIGQICEHYLDYHTI